MSLPKKYKLYALVFVVLFLGWLFFYPLERDRLDAEARRLCAIDGGLKLNEAVILPSEKFYENGLPKIRDTDDQGFGYFVVYEQKNLSKDFIKPFLIREHRSVIRSNDQKVIATYVIYRRHGGSWWDGLIVGDGYSCPSDHENVSYLRQIFRK